MASPLNHQALRVGLWAYILLILGPLALKLSHQLTLSWWLVTVFLWGPLVFTLVFGLLSTAWALLRPRRR